MGFSASFSALQQVDVQIDELPVGKSFSPDFHPVERESEPLGNAVATVVETPIFRSFCIRYAFSNPILITAPAFRVRIMAIVGTI